MSGAWMRDHRRDDKQDAVALGLTAQSQVISVLMDSPFSPLSHSPYDSPSALAAQFELSQSPESNTFTSCTLKILPFILSALPVHSRSWNKNSHRWRFYDSLRQLRCSVLSLYVVHLFPSFLHKIGGYGVSLSFRMDNLVSHKVLLAAEHSSATRSDVWCDDVQSFSQNWPQQLCGNRTSTGAAERVKLNLFVNAGAHHCVTQRGEAVIGLCITVSWQTATVSFSLWTHLLAVVMAVSLLLFSRRNCYTSYPLIKLSLAIRNQLQNACSIYAAARLLLLIRYF